jgi:hypothetical protein
VSLPQQHGSEPALILATFFGHPSHIPIATFLILLVVLFSFPALFTQPVDPYIARWPHLICH